MKTSLRKEAKKIHVLWIRVKLPQIPHNIHLAILLYKIQKNSTTYLLFNILKAKYGLN